MESINFKNTSKPNQNVNYSKDFKKIQETFSKIADEYTKCLSPALLELSKNLSQLVSSSLNDTLLKINEIFENSINNSNSFKVFNEVMENIALNAVLPSITTKSHKTETNKESEKEIKFTDEQLTHIENLNININFYCDSEKSSKNNKFFTFDRLIAFIGLLMTILTTFKPNTEVNLNEQQMQEIVEIKNAVDETNDVLQSILEQLDEATCDESEH